MPSVTAVRLWGCLFTFYYTGVNGKGEERYIDYVVKTGIGSSRQSLNSILVSTGAAHPRHETERVCRLLGLLDLLLGQESSEVWWRNQDSDSIDNAVDDGVPLLRRAHLGSWALSLTLKVYNFNVVSFIVYSPSTADTNNALEDERLFHWWEFI